ncbi:NAD(P)-binding protein [Auricularia subglabra TFB-10046 SS5]|nr:NAD(P)-binding protein [Auricularia subglabra TFB-10046 SS5]
MSCIDWACASRSPTKNEEELKRTTEELRAICAETDVLAITVDVSSFDAVKAFADKVFQWSDEVNVVLNNAGVGLKSGSWSDLDVWKTMIDVNLMGIVNVQHAFVPHMMPNENPGLFINTGSKQGITNPPGNPAYNASKAAVKSITESLAHELRAAQSKLTAHLLVPGWTYTGMTGAGKGTTKPAGAWTPQQTVRYMLERVRMGNFYIICPDNETSSALDRLRIRWGAEDVIEGRPALSRWDAEYAPLFEEFVRAGLVSEQGLSPTAHTHAANGI